ncbi:MAG: gliding motility-associated C-terminal domain-containing protein [Flavobacteriales bacterium]|nr:gliding motility-associated C-terminal domain-containing protein [Flavobacteriales bacterium]
MKKILSILTFFSFIVSTYASHVPGGNITYECLGNNQYLLTLTLFEDCGTAFESGSNQSVSIANDCGYTSLTTVSLTNTIFQQEVSQLCSSQLPQSECSGGTMPGVYMHQWQGVVTLPGNCDSWVFSYSSCCRNTSTNASSSSANYYWESVLNSTTAPCNNSPVITGQPIPYNCVNQPVNYSMGVYEPDGNTLSYSLIPAMTSSTGSITYLTGYTGASPIPGISVDPITGEITFTPTTIGNYIVAVLIEEYDANGNLVGSVIQDFQFEVISCAGNNNPVPPVAGVSNVSGTGFSTGPNDVQLCEGDNICFDVVFTDAASDSIYLTSTLQNVFPGGTFTQTSWIGGTATATICFTVPGGANPFSVITINASDNACPVVGVSSMSVGVTVVSSTTAGADETICLGSPVQLQASGGSNFQWSLVSGDPITPANFSCTNCPDPIANPSVTSVYEVTSNLSGGCTNTDQITVNVVPDFTYSLTQSSTTSCLNSDIDLAVIPNIAGNYSYTWSPATFLSSTTSATPTLTPTTPGNYTYAVEIVSQDGCVKNDTIDITVASAYAPDVTVTTNLTNIMCGDTIFFNTDLGGGVPASCGPSATTACSAPSSTIDVGTATGANTTTTFPAPFGHWYRNARHQFLFTAAELQAAGFVGGKITEIAWQVTAINGQTTYPGYKVYMGCTGTSSLTTWETGLTQVMNSQNVTISTGWNTLALTTAYEWDGISNLVVEVCYDLVSSVSYTQNSITPWTTTTFTSSLYYRSDSQVACGTTSAPSTSTNRPVTRFTTCPTIPDPNNYTFEWTSTVGGTQITTPSSQNPYALPMETQDIQLVVTDLNGGCTDTVVTHIDVLCDTCQAPIPTLTNITCFGGADGEILAAPFGINGPPFDLELLNPTTLAVLESAPGVMTTYNFTGLTAGSYMVRSYDTTGCWADTIVTLTQPPIMALSTSQDTIVCIGGTATMSASATGGNSSSYSYIWSGLAGTTSVQNASPSAVTTYDVYALDPFGCSSDTLGITVNMYPPILTTPSAPDTVCPGFGGTVGVTPNGGFGAFFSYLWTDSDGNTVGMQNMIPVTPNESPETYYVTVTDGCETPAKVDSVTVYWYGVPQPLISADVTEGCYPVEVNFTNNTDPSMLSTCQWYFGDGGTSGNCGDQTHTYNSVGVYNVTLIVTSPDGCVGDTTYMAMIEAFDYPVADFGIYPNPITILEPTTTMYDSSSSDVTSFDWSFGDNGILGSSTHQNPEFTFPDDSATNFTVQLIVTNANGCTDTADNIVVMNGVYSFYVPSGFTPNGDGVNDEFFPKGEGLNPLEYEMFIFDRWGNKIFETTQTNATWDGKINGEPAPSGVYVWKIYTTDIYKDEKHENLGHVTLIR